MEDNPISWLQIEVSKYKILPTYTLIEQQIGSHINLFKISLKCGIYNTEGEGSSKKEAKINAATKMINLLYPNKNLNLFKHPNIFNSNNNDDKSKRSLQISALSSPTNFIGKLQEFAVINSVILPEYIHKSTVGESHRPLFTMVCKYNGLEEEAIGNTKKEAKSLAAQKMFNRVSSDIKIITPNLLQMSNLENIQLAMQNYMNIGINNYLKLRSPTLHKSKENNKITYDESYRFLKDRYSYKDRELVLKILKNVIQACENEIISIYIHKNTISKVMIKLTTALDILKIKVQRINCIASKTHIYNLQLNTNPIISEIAHGKSIKEAEINAIFHIAETILIMLL